jgi:hypothetical protein
MVMQSDPVKLNGNGAKKIFTESIPKVNQNPCKEHRTSAKHIAKCQQVTFPHACKKSEAEAHSQNHKDTKARRNIRRT